MANANASSTLKGLQQSAVAKTQVRFSTQHLLAAASFSRHVFEIEQNNKDESLGPFFDEILWNATACVFGCVAFLEAYANEFFIDRAKHLPDLRPEVGDRLWELYEQENLLKKFEFALILKNAPALDRSARPYQDIDALISLRNALTHFKPEWEDEQKTHKKVSKKLQGRFQPSPFMRGALFPRTWATHGCTKWSVDSSIQFLEEFERIATIDGKVGTLKARVTP